jgi:hypothetical protein
MFGQNGGTAPLRTYDTFPTFSGEKKIQPPSFEEFLEINFQFLWYEFYTGKVIIINSLVDCTPDGQARGPGFDPRREYSIYSYIFVITTH